MLVGGGDELSLRNDDGRPGGGAGRDICGVTAFLCVNAHGLLDCLGCTEQRGIVLDHVQNTQQSVCE